MQLTDRDTIIFSDPHIGLKRAAHTTAASRAMLQSDLFNLALNISNLPGKKVCCGDLFDEYSNDERTILQGLRVASACSIVVGGNHDVINVKGKHSSLGLVGAVAPSETTVVMPVFNEVVVEPLYVNGHLFVTVPHHSTQELFEGALDQALAVVNEEKSRPTTNNLLLHCNYATAYDTTETSLNLTHERAKQLTNSFDHVFIGHEHVPASHLSGKVQIIGNTMPTSFSDVSDKRLLVLKEDGELESVPVWSKDDRYRKFDVTSDKELQESIGNGEGMSEDVQFVELVGTTTVDDIGTLAKIITDLWKANPNLLMVRNNVQVEGAEVSAEAPADVLEALPTLIEKELAGTPLLKMWKDLTNRGVQDA